MLLLLSFSMFGSAYLYHNSHQKWERKLRQNVFEYGQIVTKELFVINSVIIYEFLCSLLSVSSYSWGVFIHDIIYYDIQSYDLDRGW